jgi:diketogulonate reductase-like aldo/keto reductase
VGLAEKHGKTAAQVLIRYSLQKGFVPLPKSENEERIEENAHVFDFELSEGDMADLDSLGARKR